MAKKKIEVDEQAAWAKKEEVELPSSVEMIDLMNLENLSLKREVAQRDLVSLQRDIEQATREFRSKYALTEKDDIDPKTLKIIRR